MKKSKTITFTEFKRKPLAVLDAACAGRVFIIKKRGCPPFMLRTFDGLLPPNAPVWEFKDGYWRRKKAREIASQISVQRRKN